MSNIEKLEKLAELKKNGILTEEEFEMQKKDLLSAKVETNTEGKSSVAYALLGFFLGFLGLHNFYIGRWVQGLIQLLFTFVFPFVFGIVNLIWVALNLILTRRDVNGQLMQPNSFVLGTVLGVILLVLSFGCLVFGGWILMLAALN